MWQLSGYNLSRRKSDNTSLKNSMNKKIRKTEKTFNFINTQKNQVRTFSGNQKVKSIIAIEVTVRSRQFNSLIIGIGIEKSH